MNEPNKFPDKGDCYESSLVNAKELQDIKDFYEKENKEEFKQTYESYSLKDEIRICHGWVKTGSGKRGHHAWIEIGKYVIETQGGQRNRDDKNMYYKAFEVVKNEEYSIEEALKLWEKQSKYGAWRGKGNDRAVGERQNE